MKVGDKVRVIPDLRTARAQRAAEKYIFETLKRWDLSIFRMEPSENGWFAYPYWRGEEGVDPILFVDENFQVKPIHIEQKRIKTMKLIDLIQNLDKEKTEDKQFNIQPLFDEFNIDRWNMKDEEYDLFYEHVHCYYVIKWYCTDSCVGLRFYYLDDEFICLSNQLGRKYNEEFEFASQEAYDKLEKFLIQFRFKQDKEELSKLNLDQEISEFYDISFNGQLIREFHKYAIDVETDEKIEIDYKWEYMKYRYSFDSKTWQKVKDKNSDRIFEIKDLKFQIPLINKKEKN